MLLKDSGKGLWAHDKFIIWNSVIVFYCDQGV